MAQASEARRGQGFGIAEIVMPDRDLLPGVEIDTDLGVWQVYETPGHAPSHVVLHQPERGLLLSGRSPARPGLPLLRLRLLARPSRRVPASLDVVDGLDVQLILAGHGRPVREAHALIEANRARRARARGPRARARSSKGPRTPYEIVPEMLDSEMPTGMMLNWGLTETLCYLRHLERLGEAAPVEDAEPALWALGGPRRSRRRASTDARRAGRPGSTALPGSG